MFLRLYSHIYMFFFSFSLHISCLFSQKKKKGRAKERKRYQENRRRWWDDNTFEANVASNHRRYHCHLQFLFFFFQIPNILSITKPQSQFPQPQSLQPLPFLLLFFFFSIPSQVCSRKRIQSFIKTQGISHSPHRYVQVFMVFNGFPRILRIGSLVCSSENPLISIWGFLGTV